MVLRELVLVPGILMHFCVILKDASLQSPRSANDASLYLHDPRYHTKSWPGIKKGNAIMTFAIAAGHKDDGETEAQMKFNLQVCGKSL